jgi:hypothetical protein
LYVRNSGDRRPPTEQIRGRTQRPVHISQSRPRDIIPPPDYSGTVLYDTVIEVEPVAERKTEVEESISLNPRSETQTSGGKGGIPTSNNAALFASGHLPFEDKIREEILNLDNSDSEDDNRPVPRRPLISRDDYEDSSDNRPDPRYPLASDTDSSAYTEEDTNESTHPVITHRNGHSYRPVSSLVRKESKSAITASANVPSENKMPLSGLMPLASDDLLLCGLIVLLLLSGSDDELIIILAFLLLAH